MAKRRRFKPRKGQTREPRVSIVVVCEDTSSGPRYIRAALEHLGFDLREPAVRFEHAGGTSPKQVVAKAAEAVDELQVSTGSGAFAWAVFDRDKHLGFDEACDACNNKSVHNAMTNPCFEYWLHLHVERPPAGKVDDHSKAQREFGAVWRTLFPTEHYSKGKADFERFLQHENVDLDRAVKHAKQSCKDFDGTDTPWVDRTPCSHLGDLFEWFRNARYDD